MMESGVSHSSCYVNISSVNTEYKEMECVGRQLGRTLTVSSHRVLVTKVRML